MHLLVDSALADQAWRMITQNRSRAAMIGPLRRSCP